MKPIIRAEALTKQYRVGERGSSFATLRDLIAEASIAPYRRLRRAAGNGNRSEQYVWALRDVSFEVRPGEVVGIIGKNGAGKSTLLKVLSRITEPTSGIVQLYGRVASLLEVGTGFHPELTGRENIMMNGAILGMQRSEINRKFDEIVAFAEIERFIDTPIKWYSSGMYMRLAFAVAAHLEPEILIVDEVLAVGDISFQKKCLNKMESVSRGGRTVLFVSHNMQAILRLCPRAMILDEGRVKLDGPAHEVTSFYLGDNSATPAAREWPKPEEAPGDATVRLRGARVKDSSGHISGVIDVRDPVTVEIEYDVLQPGRRLSGGIICYNEEGVCLFSAADLSPQSIYSQDVNFTGRRVTACKIPDNLMPEGKFMISVGIYAILDAKAHIRTDEILAFRVVDTVEGDSARGVYTGPVMGVMRPRLEWETWPASLIEADRHS